MTKQQQPNHDANREGNETRVQRGASGKLIAFGGGIKAYRDDAGKMRAGGYLVKFTDENRRDLHGEYFTAKTDYQLATHPLIGKPVLYEHGFDDAIETLPLGYIDAVEVRSDGIYVEYELTLADNYTRQQVANHGKSLKQGEAQSWAEKQRAIAKEYQANVWEMLEDGTLGWSSGALQQSVDVDDNGEIKRWVIIEGSNTPRPAMPKDTRIMTIKNYKSSRGDNMAKKRNLRQEAQDAVAVLVEFLEDEIPAEELEEATTDAEVESLVEEFMEDVIADTVEELSDEPSMMMTDEDEEKMDDEEYEKRVKKQVKASILAVAKRRRNAIIARRNASKSVAKRLAEKRVPKSDLPNASGANPMKATQPRITVSDSLKYAHLTPHQMALGIKMTAAKLKSQGHRVNTLSDMNHVLSDEYMRTAVHKSVGHFKSLNATDDMTTNSDRLAVKTSMPFKADELNAIDIATQGQEWVETFYDTQLWERARDTQELFNRMVSKGMRVVTIPEGAGGMNVKKSDTSATMTTAPEANDVDAVGNPQGVAAITPFGTGEVDVPAKTHIIASGITYALTEDSIINVLAYVDEDMVTTLGEGTENTMINGDTATAINTNINLIDGTPATGTSTPLYIAWDGIRKNFLVTNTSRSDDASGAFALDWYNKVIGLFGDEVQARTSRMLFVIDSATSRATRAELGKREDEQSVLYFGEFPELYGVEIYTSTLMKRSNTAGKISGTGGNNLFGTIAGVYAPYWQYGRKRAITIEEDRYARSQTSVFVATIRHAFAPRGIDASAGVYNLLV